MSLLRALFSNKDLVQQDQVWSRLWEARNEQLRFDEDSAIKVLDSIGEVTTEYQSFAMVLIRFISAHQSGRFDEANNLIQRIRNHSAFAEPGVAAIASFRIGVFLRLRSDFDEATLLQLEASETFRSLEWRLEEALCINEIGSILFSRGDFNGAVRSYTSVIDIIRHEGGDDRYSGVLANLAGALYHTGNKREAERRFTEVLKTDLYSKPTIGRADQLMNLAVIYRDSGRLEAAEQCYVEALSCVGNDVSSATYQRIRVNLSDVLSQRGENEEARKQLENLKALDHDNTPSFVRIQIRAALAMVLHKLGNDELAIANLREARVIARENCRLEENHRLLAEALGWVEDPALRMELLDEYRHVQDQRLSILTSSTSALLELRASFERERSRLYRERQNELARVVLDTQTTTVRDIGRELHDSLGQDLIVLMRVADRLMHDHARVPADLVPLLSTLRDVSHRASSDARRIAHLLADGGVSGNSLAEALNALRDDAHQAEPDLDLEVVVSGSLDDMPHTAARTIYRIVQTLLQNVVRHSKARSCSVNIVVHHDHYHLGVDDDGVGFAVSSVHAGMGLREMRARAELLGGRVRIESSPGQGTHTEVVIPRKLRVG